ncbi:MAG: sulfurtransferase [Gammaproteobacteria bacterium]|nr:MAG: sulfurtransferase [Gammaproteobacteria bacterium]
MEHLGEFIINHWILVTAFVVLLFMVMSDQLNRKLSGVNNIAAAQAVQIVNQQKGLFLDVRDTAEYTKEHIADSISLPLSKIDDDVSLKDTEKAIVLICASGQRARTAAKQLQKKGFTNIHVLNGGLNSWRDAKLPLFS